MIKTERICDRCESTISNVDHASKHDQTMQGGIDRKKLQVGECFVRVDLCSECEQLVETKMHAMFQDLSQFVEPEKKLAETQ